MFLSIINDSMVPTIKEPSTYIEVFGQLLIFEEKKTAFPYIKKIEKIRQNKSKKLKFRRAFAS